MIAPCFGMVAAAVVLILQVYFFYELKWGEEKRFSFVQILLDEKVDLVKAKDLLLFQKFGRQLFYIYCPSFCGQSFERAENLWAYLVEFVHMNS